MNLLRHRRERLALRAELDVRLVELLRLRMENARLRVAGMRRQWQHKGERMEVPA
jgi:hypothetical protein